MLCGSKVTIRKNRVVQTKDQGKQHFDGIACLRSSFKFTWSRALEEYFLTFSAHGEVISEGDCLNTGYIIVSMKVLCSGWPRYWSVGEMCGSFINKNWGAGRILAFLRKGPGRCISNLSENDDAKPVKDNYFVAFSSSVTLFLVLQ